VLTVNAFGKGSRRFSLSPIALVLGVPDEYALRELFERKSLLMRVIRALSGYEEHQ
jgi:hypothetical protein